MRLCPACGSAICGNDAWVCDACAFQPDRIDGVLAFAPDLSDEVVGMNPAGFAKLEALEQESFWFQARNRLILRALRKFRPDPSAYLEIGCGTGFVLRAVAAAFPDLAVTGSELHVSGLNIARQRMGARADFLQLDARHLPFREEFDVIGSFDVLEHIEEDEGVILAVREALRPGGIFLATVPQHPSLWSPSDDMAHHVRRYCVGELDRKVRDAGMKVLMSTSFVALLLPALVLARGKAREADNYEPEAEMQLGATANAIATLAMTFERWMIACGLRFPIGGSRLLVARKPPA